MNREPLIRFLLCFIIGALTLQRDESFSYDRRFQIRGEQSANPQIVVLTISPQDFSSYDFRTLRTRAQFEDLADLSDSIYWSKENWYQLLSKVLEQNPKSVAISLYFEDSLRSKNLSNKKKFYLKILESFGLIQIFMTV